jgi:hypothetical protein
VEQTLLIESNAVLASTIGRIFIARAANLVDVSAFMAYTEQATYLALATVFARDGRALTRGRLRWRWLLVAVAIAVVWYVRWRQLVRMRLHWLRRLIHVRAVRRWV